MSDMWLALTIAGVGLLGVLLGGLMTVFSTLKTARISQESMLKTAEISQDREDRRVRREELKELINAFSDAAIDLAIRESRKLTRPKTTTSNSHDVMEENKRIARAKNEIAFTRERLILFDPRLEKTARALSEAASLGNKFPLGINSKSSEYKKVAADFRSARSAFNKEARKVLEIDNFSSQTSSSTKAS